MRRDINQRLGTTFGGGRGDPEAVVCGRDAVDITLGLMKTVKLQLSDDTGSTFQIEASFDSDDLALLASFHRLMRRIYDASLTKRGLPFVTNLNWEAGRAPTFTAPEFTNAELHELLHVLRPVILEKEKASFHKVQALLGKKFKDGNFAEHLKAVRHLFDDGELSRFMQISIGGQKLWDKSILHTWLNGVQYHTDAEKAETWQKLESILTEDNARAVVISQIHSRVKALALLDHVVSLVLGDDEA